MNPVLVILVMIGAGLVWLLCAGLYKPIGAIISRLINDSKRAMFEDDNTKEEKETKK